MYINMRDVLFLPSDMLRQFMNHNEFEFDRVFDENADNATVYAATAKTLVDITLQGGFSTCMVYGQTGQVLLGSRVSHLPVSMQCMYVCMCM